jgi:hypothetical protein
MMAYRLHMGQKITRLFSNKLGYNWLCVAQASSCVESRDGGSEESSWKRDSSYKYQDEIASSEPNHYVEKFHKTAQITTSGEYDCGVNINLRKVVYQRTMLF